MRFGTPLRGSCITHKDAGNTGFAGSETSARAVVTQPADFVATKINDFKE